MQPLRLIVGLGNPGAQYEDTRHNAGFWWVEALAQKLGVSLKPESKFHGRVARWAGKSGEIWLLCPDTFMNLSGKSVAALARFYKIEPESVLVAHDELDLLPGSARFKQGGGHGGHNGLKDMHTQLGSSNYWRLRIGIGHPGDREAVIGYVLGKPQMAERDLIEKSIEAALDVWPELAAGNLPAAQLKLHTVAKT
ncbi:MAG: aminoacyl-tRNA hydrolase [Candidatus Rokuibacteriota bacterium]